MWWGHFTFQLLWRAGWWRSFLMGGMREAQATFRGQLVILTMKEGQTILGGFCTQCMLYSVYAVLSGCCTQCMLYSVYAVLSVDSWSWNGERERDDLTLHSAMIEEKERCGMTIGKVWRVRADMSNQGTTCLIQFIRRRISVFTPRIVSSTCRISNGKLSRTRKSLNSQFLELISPILSHLSRSLSSRKNTKLSHPYLSLHAMIIGQRGAHHAQSTSSSQDRQYPATSQSLISWRTIFYTTLSIPTITSSPMNRVSAAIAPPSQSTSSRSATTKYSSNVDRSFPQSAFIYLLNPGL